MIRDNPKVSRTPARVRRFLNRHGERLRRGGVDVDRLPLGCGVFGCTYPTKSAKWVLKMTRDRSESDLFRVIHRIRSGVLKPRLDSSRTLALSALGITPAWVRKVPGFVATRGKIHRVGWWDLYYRESIRPIVDFRDGTTAQRATYRRAREAFDYLYDHDPDPRDFVGRYPEYRVIALTLAGIDLVYGIRVEDVHDEQVGIVTHGSTLHTVGTPVLYDGQV